ncbi:DUF6512 family protein [Clostridium cylindrosporum]|uniref:Uncharacterized protein n=1 Tax=Clostridium cylindrosporum DSM 605 TaxID=1121307 RepID=A0A0J8D837_CLOCY|nr:DUF6512 family protein [Clostridium cylindrosporum]KMT22225.1 hypothetical protein CLCY_4c01980 [Clostridium cylindrosporum DSM 605]
MDSFKKAKKWILIGIPIISIVGSLMHFAYEWSGNLALVGLFTPVNESIWEHLKMAFFPTLAWWILGYLIYRGDFSFNTRTWLSSAVVASITAPLVVVTFYYTYTGAFGIESLVLDIFSLFLGIFIGQILGLHLYRYGKFNPLVSGVLYLILILVILAFIVFTFNPPHIPLFLDSQTGTYGI